jgi:hypothetical protein
VKGNFGVKKVKAPSKNPKKGPIICFAPDKKNHLLDFQNQRNIVIFMSLREQEREREKESESKGKSKSESESKKEKEKGKGKRERERERAKVWVTLFLNS